MPPRIRKQLNILMIVTDQQQPWATLPGNLALPHQKDLAAQSTNFNKYQQNAVVCGPSRSVLYTGQHVQHTGVTQNPDQAAIFSLKPETPTLGTLLREQGYYTAYKGKWHLHNINWEERDDNSDALEPYGFSDYTSGPEPVGYALEGLDKDPRTASDACDWLMEKGRALIGEQPWFLAVNFINPHDIMFFDATGEQSDTRQARIFIDRLNDEPDNPLYQEDLGYDLPKNFYDRDSATKPFAHGDYLATNDYIYGEMPWENEEAWRRFQNYYLNCLRDVDRHIGTLLKALDESGLGDETIVLFTTDHGEMNGAHGQRQKGPFIYRENIASPMMIRHPDVEGGGSTDALMGATDVSATLLGFAGVDDAARAERYPFLKGYDLSDCLNDRTRGGDRMDKAGGTVTAHPMTVTDAAFVKGLLSKLGDDKHYPDTRGGVGNNPPDGTKRGNFRALYDGRYRFGRYFGPMEHNWPETWEALTAHNDVELYDTANDEHEMNNLGAKPEANKALILGMNEKLNAILDDEVGREQDQGTFFPGPNEMWRL